MRIGATGTPGTLQKFYNNVIYNNYEGATTASTVKNMRTSLTSGTIDLQYCAYDGGTAAATGSAFATTGNISSLSAPAFVSPSTTKGYSAIMPNDVMTANFALQSTSALINVGGSTAGLTDLPLNDLLGYERPYGTSFDMGAYEYGSTNLTTVNNTTNNHRINVLHTNDRTIISDIDGVIEIISISGKVLINKKVTIGSEIALSSGFYVIRARTANNSEILKVIL